MKFYVVSPLRVTHRRQNALTYHSGEQLLLGQVVSVPVGSKIVAAVVIQNVPKPEFETKAIETIVTSTPLPKELLDLNGWLAQYYASHPVAVWQTMLPSGILKKRRKMAISSVIHARKRTHYVLNTHQQRAFDAICEQPSGTTLLHGVTGSGKTAIYIELALKTLAEGKSVIVLVPEIALTSQIVADFTSHIDNVLVTHSTMTEAARHAVWLDALTSSNPRVVIGPRSALFTPLSNIGLIVIDECHEPSYKQEKSPRYSALRVASVLAKNHKARLVLGSATPSVSDYYVANASAPDYIVTISELAQPGAVLPSVTVVDMTKRLNFSRSSFLSNELLAALEANVREGKQSLLFHNRRGSAPITLCENCGWSASCPRCFVPLTLHADRHHLRCHLCNHQENVPTACPSCSHASIIHKGIGTKRVEEEVRRLFPSARVARFDGDNQSTETVDSQYQALYDGEIDIIIGTQVIAKGLDLPHLRLVGIIQADSGLALPDYQSSERVFQLLAQVAGRVGRNEHESFVVVQSYQPDHPSVRYGIARDYKSFYEEVIAERKRAVFPPFCYLLKMTCVYKSEAAAIRAAQTLAKELRARIDHDSQLLGPTPAFYERTRDSYRWQLIVKGKSRAKLMALTEFIPQAYWQFELDPVSLL